MAGHDECIEKIDLAAGKTLGKAGATRLLVEVAERADRMRQTGESDPFVTAAHDLAARSLENARQVKLDALRNATVRNTILGEIERQGGPRKADLTLRSLLHGTNKGGRDNIESQWRGNAALWQGAVSAELRKAGLEKVAISGALDRDIARELWAINAGAESKASPTDPARRIATILAPAIEQAKNRLNGVGARIGDAADYVAHTTHDPEKMRAAAGPGMSPTEAFEAWWKTTEPLLSEKTFETVTPGEDETAAMARRRFGKSVYDALVTGIHMTAKGVAGLTEEGGYVPPAYEGTRNLAKKLSQPRVLFWKDGESWHAYQSRFGQANSVTDGIMRTLDVSARQLALMDKLGTNPTANFNQIIRRIQEKYRDDIDGVRAFQAKVPGLENVMAHLDGSANIPANELAAKIGGGIRTWESVSSLGGVGITHFASIWPTVTSELTHHGVNRLETLGNMVKALIEGRGSAERQEVLADLGAYAHGLTRDMFNRWQADDNVPGRISAMANTFMKYTGIHYVFDNTQAAVRAMLSHQLGRGVGKSFAELDPNLSQMLGKYGIGASEWDLLRNVGDLPVVDDRAYMTPKDGLRIDPAAAEALLRARGLIGKAATPKTIASAVDQLRNGLSDKLASYYGDAAAHSTVTAGVRERAAVLGQDRPGSFGGELRRYLLQFKMWPLAAMNQVIGREIYTSLSRGQAAWNLGTLAALSMAGGYLRMAVNDVARGNPVRDPRDPATLMAALAQGGGVGILGDFLFGEVNRMGGGLIGTLGGPVVSDADALVHIFNRFRKDATGTDPHRNGQFGDIWPDLAHFGVKHVPFANLVYLKGVLDYTLWYHLYEAASPGWWERTNRRLAREQGRTMSGYAPGRGVPWSPWGVAQQETQ